MRYGSLCLAPDSICHYAGTKPLVSPTRLFFELARCAPALSSLQRSGPQVRTCISETCSGAGCAYCSLPLQLCRSQRSLPAFCHRSSEPSPVAGAPTQARRSLFAAVPKAEARESVPVFFVRSVDLEPVLQPWSRLCLPRLETAAARRRKQPQQVRPKARLLFVSPQRPRLLPTVTGRREGSGQDFVKKRNSTKVFFGPFWTFS